MYYVQIKVEMVNNYQFISYFVGEKTSKLNLEFKHFIIFLKNVSFSTDHKNLDQDFCSNLSSTFIYGFDENLYEY